MGKIADFDFEKPKECDAENMSIADGVACVQKGFSQVFKFGCKFLIDQQVNKKPPQLKRSQLPPKNSSKTELWIESWSELKR